nr:nucleotidyltransferase domain-containing protein [uncultured Acetatifactor sp.]
MSEIVLNDAVIKKVKEEAADMVKTAMGKDLVKIVLYGSCARGDYTQDSDIDIALIMACDRLEAKKYNEIIAEISMQLAMKYFSVVNFVCLPYAEYAKKKEILVFLFSEYRFRGRGVVWSLKMHF